MRIFYVVQQLTLPSPRIFFIRTSEFSGNPSGMNSPEFLSVYQKIHPLQIFTNSLFIESFQSSFPHISGRYFCLLIKIMILNIVTPIYKETSPEDQETGNRLVNIPLLTLFFVNLKYRARKQ